MATLQYGVNAILTIWRQWRSLQCGVNGDPYNMASMAIPTIWRQWRSLQCGVRYYVPPSRGDEAPRGIPRAPPAGLRPASGALGIPLVAPFYDRALK